jgi:hypothetical protein
VEASTATAAPEGGDEQEPPAPARTAWAPTINNVALLGLVIVALRVGFEPLIDNSFFTHLSTGRIILDGGGIPRHDPYSWTAPGRAWTVQSWGASVIYAGLERGVGLVGIRILSATCMVILVLLLWRLTAPADRLVGRLVAATLAVALGTALWLERPLLLGAVFLTLLMVIVEERRDPRWLVPIMWCWVNVHGSFPFAIGLVGLLAAGQFLDTRERPDVELRALGWTVVGTLLGAVGPLGTRLLVFPFDLLSRREAFGAIAEWKPPAWERPVEKLFAVQLVLVVVLTLLRNRRWRAILPLVVFAGLALTSARNIVQASIVFTLLLAAALRDLGHLRGDRPLPILRAAFASLAVVAVVVTVSGLQQPDVDRSPYPLAASRWMRSEGLLDTRDRVVTRDFVGNYLEFEYGPDEVRTFIDDRVDMYPVGLIRDYVVLIRPGGDYQAVLDRWRASAVLWDRDSALGKWLASSDRWKVVHQDATWLVAVPEAAT